jgi:hypothetical protein
MVIRSCMHGGIYKKLQAGGLYDNLKGNEKLPLKGYENVKAGGL